MVMSRRRLVFWLFALGILLLPAAALGDTVLVVTAEDAGAASWLQGLDDAAAEALHARGLVRAEGKPTAAQTESLLSCARKGSGCGDLLARWHGDQVLVLAVAERDDGAEEIVLNVTGWLLSKDGAVVAVDRRFCERCDADALGRAAADLVTALLNQAASRRSRASLLIGSTPTGARVMVDNQPVGVTDLEYNVLPGDHVVSIDKPGYGVEVRKVTVLEGQKLDVKVSLQPGGSPNSDRERKSRLAPWLLTGTGIAAIGVGVTLALMDSPEVEGDVRQRKFRESLFPGLAVAGCGAVLTAVGSWWLLRSHRTKAAPTVAASGGGLFVGAMGRF